jgi:hypothetical protein
LKINPYVKVKFNKKVTGHVNNVEAYKGRKVMLYSFSSVGVGDG